MLGYSLDRQEPEGPRLAPAALSDAQSHCLGCGGVEWSSQALGPLSLGPRNLEWGPSQTFAAALPHSSH